MKLPEKLEKAIDGIGLLIALIVDMIVIPICMVTIAPNILTKIAFVAIGITIVLFVFRSWAKGQRVAWVIFASVVFFFDFSFALVMTQIQSEKIDILQDSELVRIDREVLDAQERIKNLQTERTISTRPETIASISSDIKTENQNILGFTVDRKAREKELKKTGGVYITADSVFTSIPDAIKKSRIIPLVIFGLIFIGLQMVIVTSIDSPDKKNILKIAPDRQKSGHREVSGLKKDKLPVELKRVSIEGWIDILWAGEKKGIMHIPSMDVLTSYYEKKGYLFDKEEHERRIYQAVRCGLMDQAGNLLKSKQNAQERIVRK